MNMVLVGDIGGTKTELAIYTGGSDPIVTLNVGEPVPGTAVGVIVPGTGLGESFLTWDGSRYVPHSSEGGHADFAPTNIEQSRLFEYMLTRLGHVSVERVCSGIGVPNIYEYLRDVEHVEEAPEVARAIDAAKDRTKAIIDAALSGGNKSRLCRATVETLASILAAEAGNLALKVLATGGIYRRRLQLFILRDTAKRSGASAAFRTPETLGKLVALYEHSGFHAGSDLEH